MEMAIENCKELIGRAQPHSDRHKNLVQKLVQLRLKLQELKVHGLVIFFFFLYIVRYMYLIPNRSLFFIWISMHTNLYMKLMLFHDIMDLFLNVKICLAQQVKLSKYELSYLLCFFEWVSYDMIFSVCLWLWECTIQFFCLYRIVYDSISSVCLGWCTIHVYWFLFG